MWWCCLKKGIRAPGCKTQKHECKDDEDDLEDEDPSKKEKVNKNVRCFCCKELGHDISNCPRDPNIKTDMMNEADQEMKRIMSIKDKRKLYADTQVLTTHFLKKCVAVPKYDEDDLEEAADLRANLKRDPDKLRMPTAEEYEELQEMYRRNKFKRGGMTCDDYNYSNFNKFILVDPTNPGAGETSSEDEIMSGSDVKSKKFYEPGGEMGEQALLSDNILD